ncbi:MAG: DinB family protein [Acidimicrobiia bacterium]
MSTRPLRQHYVGPDGEAVRVDVDPSLRPVTRPWTAQRERLLTLVQSLTPGDWARATRCDAWNVKEVIGHLVVVDQFWCLTLGNGRAGNEPTQFLRHFDPSSSTDDLVAATAEAPIPQLVEQFAQGTAALAETVAGFTDQTWSRRAEGPLGHLPCHQLLAHALWDSWLHERDILVPVDAAPEPAADELLAVAAWNLCFAALQGGLVGDPDAVGPGPEQPIDVTLRFDDVPDAALQVIVSDGVAIRRADPAIASAAGRAVDFVEGLTGRRPVAAATSRLPPDRAAQVTRAAATL